MDTFLQVPFTVTSKRGRYGRSKCSNTVYLKAHAIVHCDTSAVLLNGWTTHLWRQSSVVINMVGRLFPSPLNIGSFHVRSTKSEKNKTNLKNKTKKHCESWFFKITVAYLKKIMLLVTGGSNIVFHEMTCMHL